MTDLDIIGEKDVRFDEYKGWFEKYKGNNDVREINFQNEVVKKFISAICPDLDVENSENKGPESGKHDYLQYCGAYIDKTGKEKATTPDLVIAKNWNWLNKEVVVDYRAVVEVKSPYEQPIYHKDYEEYPDNLKRELIRHLTAKNNNKVILTDAMKWEFYKKIDEDKKLVPIRTFRLYDMSGGGGKWAWKKGEQGIVKNDVIKEIFEDSLRMTKPIKEFEELKNFLKEFLN